MHKIHADMEKNRLYISLGESNGQDIRSVIDDACKACKALASGFTCLIHFRRGTLLRREDEGVIFALQDALCTQGVKKAAYVRQEGSVIGRFQFEMLHIHSECPAEDAASLEEAEAILDRP